MTTRIHTARGEDVEVLDPSDLAELKDTVLGKLALITRWLIGVGLAAAFGVGFWAASLRAELNDHAAAIASQSVTGGQPVQDLKRDLAVTRERMSALSEQITDMKRTIERGR